ncbi:hypothetical protein [Asticcacaulis machinosus]|uniref:Methyltransferase small domain-containing protein n=1 Tax=Asticcacaulis machinosus TaxID=2984211 RepID=A0ABT5HHD0_9CAUL|nr:hypothetical protein [Asticcacaulis machinosus]MDC7675413.1 hypothetical protein [Asticcacaulis machinosus]
MMRPTSKGKAVSEQHRPAPIGGYQSDMFKSVEFFDRANHLQLFPSHPWTVRALWEVLGPILFPSWPDIPKGVVIYEPCAGLGHMVAPLREIFDPVIPSDVYDWGKGYCVRDALTFEGMPQSLNICFTNPPFDKPLKGMAERIVRQAQKSCDYVIILARSGFLFGQERQKLHHHNAAGNLRYLLPLAERAPMQLGEYNAKCSKPQEYAFFVYERGYTGTYTGLPIPVGAKARHFRPEDINI